MKDPASVSAEAELNLISRAQRGDRQAFGELVRSHRAGVINVAYRISGNVNLAEDAAQRHSSVPGRIFPVTVRARLSATGYTASLPTLRWT